MHGVRVLGPTSELRRVLRDGEPDEVLIAMPSASGELRQRIVDVAQEEGVPVKTLPGLNELISGDVNLAGQLRPVQVEDVLGREPVEVDLDEVAGYLARKTVLVTGAGGSIGSELCRQIARVGAGRIVLVDNSEPALFDIERELVGRARLLGGAARCSRTSATATKLRQVFEKYRPDVVFHAAAYKHVPLLEANPLEAVRNNVLATKIVADVAVEFETERFVLVSTDKAAQPKNLLGQSKAIVRVDRAGVRLARRRRDALRRSALRQRARLVGERDPDLPQADRARRAGDGDAQGDDAVLHDDPGGGRR